MLRLSLVISVAVLGVAQQRTTAEPGARVARELAQTALAIDCFVILRCEQPPTRRAIEQALEPMFIGRSIGQWPAVSGRWANCSSR